MPLFSRCCLCSCHAVCLILVAFVFGFLDLVLCFSSEFARLWSLSAFLYVSVTVYVFIHPEAISVGLGNDHYPRTLCCEISAHSRFQQFYSTQLAFGSSQDLIHFCALIRIAWRLHLLCSIFACVHVQSDARVVCLLGSVDFSGSAQVVCGLPDWRRA